MRSTAILAPLLVLALGAAVSAHAGPQARAAAGTAQPTASGGTESADAAADRAPRDAAAPEDHRSPPPMTLDELMHVRRMPPPGAHGWRRWADVYSAVAGFRYRALRLQEGAADVSHAQSTLLARARLKFDTDGRYSLHGGAASGRGFRGGWSDTGLGTGPPRHQFSLKELFFAARPSPILEIQVGGLYLARGESTEATSYDNDGYIVGERLTAGPLAGGRIREIALTRAYLGDLEQANVFTRLPRMARANYYQVLVAGLPHPRAAVSADFTWHSGSSVVRSATVVRVPLGGVADRVRVEHYARLDPDPAHGLAVALERRLSRRVGASIGFSRIDSGYGSLNSDATGTGRRASGAMSLELAPGVIVSAHLVRGLDGRSTRGPQTRFDLGLVFDALQAAR